MSGVAGSGEGEREVLRELHARRAGPLKSRAARDQGCRSNTPGIGCVRNLGCGMHEWLSYADPGAMA